MALYLFFVSRHTYKADVASSGWRSSTAEAFRCESYGCTSTFDKTEELYISSPLKCRMLSYCHLERGLHDLHASSLFGNAHRNVVVADLCGMLCATACMGLQLPRIIECAARMSVE